MTILSVSSVSDMSECSSSCKGLYTSVQSKIVFLIANSSCCKSLATGWWLMLEAVNYLTVIPWRQRYDFNSGILISPK